MTSSVFLAAVMQILVPGLSEDGSVVMDTWPIHWVAGLRDTVAASGERLLCPPRTVATSTLLKMPSRNSWHLRAEADRTIKALRMHAQSA